MNKLKILIVEDDPQIRKSIELFFKVFGWDCLVAEEGKEALAVLEKNNDISMILTDTNMPNGMGGVEFLSQLEKNKNKIPVAVMSGYLDNEEEVSSHPQVKKYFQKPLDLKNLSQDIKNLIKKE